MVAVGLIVALGLGFGLALRASGVRPVRITSGSMAPTIGIGDWVIVADAGNAHRGDIVEFRFSGRLQRSGDRAGCGRGRRRRGV
jgi:signal peptidase I